MNRNELTEILDVINHLTELCETYDEELVSKIRIFLEENIKKIKPIPTQEEIQNLFNYDPDTGHFTYNHNSSTGRIKKGDRAGSLDTSSGYRIIEKNRRKYQEHALAWLYVYGEYPKMIDHMNNNRSDNRICNLRLTTRAENSFNVGIQKNNTSGYKGVFYSKPKKAWGITHRIRGKRLDCKLYATAEEANEVAIAIREKYHGEFVNHG